MEIINVTDEIIEVNVTEEVITIQAPTGAYPLPNAVNSVFGRVGSIVATEGDYTLTQLGDVTLTSPANGQVLKYNGTQWVNSTDADTGITTLNTLTALSQTFATGTSGTDFNISSATSTHTFNLPTASATNRGLLSSADWTTFNAKQNALTNPVTGTGTTNALPKFTGASTIGNSNITDSGTLITLGSNTTISNGGLQVGTNTLGTNTIRVGKNITGTPSINVILNDGFVQSDVTSDVFNYRSGSRTAAASFTLTTFTHFFADQVSIGAGSSITNQQGFVVNSNMTGATTNIGFQGRIPAGTGRWNIYMDGNANNYMAGSLGIGSTSLTGYNLRVNRQITGATTAFAIQNEAIIQTDVTANAYMYSSVAGTAAASFTLSSLNHYRASQFTIGAGSTVTNQYGFIVDASLVGATNNYGFFGNIPVGANRWNLYLQGMAANYLAGDTGIGTTPSTATQLTIGGTETAVSGISRGQLINSTLVASANSDVLVGLDIAPTFTNGAFTGVRNIALRSSGDIQVANNVSYNALKTTGVAFVLAKMDATDSVVFGNNQSATQLFGVGIEFRTGAGLGAKLFNTNNFLIQNAGTYVDAGFRLDVNGTTRFIGTASSDTAILGSELAAVTGTGTNWTLAGTNLNVGGYTHTVGSVDPLTTALAAVNGTYYQIAYTITGRTTGSITINYGGTSTSGITATGATGPLALSTAVLTITPTTDFNGTVVLSIKSIGTSVASSTFASSALVIGTEIRASDISSNLFFGRNNGRRNTTGSFNTFVGSQSGINNTTGSFNTFLGTSTGANNSTGNQNIFLGFNTGNANTTGGSNTIVGTFAGQANTTGSNNIFIGVNTGASNTTGTANTFIGREAGFPNSTGSQNVMLGQNAGRYITGGSTNNTISNNSIFLGVDSRAAADNQTNQIVIGHTTTGLGSNTTVIGTTATTITGLYGNIRLVSGMGTAPASATATGTTGDIVVTAGFIYVCTATNTWVRTALTTW